jgi:K+-sensing histidine kinase KdpD
MSADETDRDAWEELLLLLVHDLRNPVATIGANVSFLRELGRDLAGGDEDTREAVVDIDRSVGELREGLDHLAWIVRWMHGRPAVSVADGDVAVAVQRVGERGDPPVRTDIRERPLRARGGGTLLRVIDLLLANSRTHARGETPLLRAHRDAGAVVVEVHDGGPAIAEELRADAFTVPGQARIKTRQDGRYGRAAALLAARTLVDAMGGSIEAGGRDGAAWFRIRLDAL